MPFPWKKPTSINCLPDDLIGICDNIDGFVWLKIIDEFDVNFFALTRITTSKYKIPLYQLKG
jgi:hypothetical protein